MPNILLWSFWGGFLFWFVLLLLLLWGSAGGGLCTAKGAIVWGRGRLIVMGEWEGMWHGPVTSYTEHLLCTRHNNRYCLVLLHFIGTLILWGRYQYPYFIGGKNEFHLKHPLKTI